MFHIDNTSGVPEMPELKEQMSNTTHWFGESQAQGGVSWPGADWFNIVQAELLNVLESAGINPDKSNLMQLTEAIYALFDKKSDKLVSKIDLLSDAGSDKVGMFNKKTLAQVIKTLLPKTDNVYDVFLVYGQSNAVGYASNTAGFPDFIHDDALWYDYRDSTFKKIVRGLAYSSGEISTGHAWAAFANEYIKLTGRKIIIIPAARGGTAAAELSKPAIPGNTTYDKMVAAVNTCYSSATALGMKLGFRSMLWHQGETDMSAGTSREDYQRTLDILMRDIRSDTGVDSCFIFRVGCPQNRTENSWYAMQIAQDFLCQSYDWMVMCYTGCGSFTIGNGLLREGVHYTQRGYNLMGAESASNVVNALFSRSPASPKEQFQYGALNASPDQIWRYTHAQLMFSGSDGWRLLTREDSGSTSRAVNINKIEVLDDLNVLRIYTQSRANWQAGLTLCVNAVGQEHGVQCAASVVTVAPNIFAFDVRFYMDISFAVSMNGTLSAPPGLNASLPAFISRNITAQPDAVSGAVRVTHSGSGKFPILNLTAAPDGSGSDGTFSIFNLGRTGFSVKTSTGKGVTVTIPCATLLPSSLMDGFQLSLGAVICDKKE